MPVQSVERAFHLLEVIAQRPGGLVAVADRAGLPLTTASRLLETLEMQAAVRREVDGTYCIGPLVQSLGGLASPTPSVRDVALPELVRLAEELGEAACLSVPMGDETLTLVQYDVARPVQAQNWEGHRWPITSGGSGAVMLSTWPEARVRPLLERLSPAERREAESMIRSAKLTGVGWSEDSRVDGLTSVAAPVLGFDGAAVAAVISYGPSYRFPGPGGRESIESVVSSAARSVTGALGGLPR